MARVTLDQLRAFERILHGGTFQGAADDLGLTQPSISQRIRELESALDTALFLRSGPRVSPTAEAHALLAYAERLLAIEGELRARFRSRDPLRGRLRVGVSENFALIGLPDLFHRLEAQYPSIQASVFVGDSGTLSEQLNRRSLDVAIVSEPAVDDRVARVPIGFSRLAWFARADHPLPRRALEPRQLAAHHLMLPPPSARLHTTVTRWFSAGHAEPSRFSTCNNAGVTRLAVLGGAAIAILPMRIMENDLAEGAVKVVAVRPAMPAHRVFVCSQESEAGPAIHALVDLIRDICDHHRLFTADPARSRPRRPAAPPRDARQSSA